MKNFDAALNKILADHFQDPEELLQEGVLAHNGEQIKQTAYGSFWYTFPSHHDVNDFINWKNDQQELADFDIKRHPESIYTIILQRR